MAILKQPTPKIKSVTKWLRVGERLAILIVICLGGVSLYLSGLVDRDNYQHDLILKEYSQQLLMADFNTKEVIGSSLEKVDGQFAASKNGTKYYPLGCSGLKRIKPENLIYFTSKEEAESRGFEPSKNC